MRKKAFFSKVLLKIFRRYCGISNPNSSH